MPIYEYKCESCEKIFEELRKIKERNSLAICPSCGAKAELIPSKASILSDNSSENMDTALDRRASLDVGRGTSAIEISDKNKAESGNPSAIYISGDSHLCMEGCTIDGFDTGISLSGDSKVDMKRTKFKNVRNPIELRDEPKKEKDNGSK